MWPSDLAPNNSDLWSSDLFLRTVNESNLLSEVEAEITVSIFSCQSQTLQTYFAALVSSTPSIWIKLVFGLVLRLPRW